MPPRRRASCDGSTIRLADQPKGPVCVMHPHRAGPAEMFRHTGGFDTKHVESTRPRLELLEIYVLTLTRGAVQLRNGPDAEKGQAEE